MDRIFSTLSVGTARSILRGVPLDVATLSDNQVDNLVTLSLHCMLNGPVGVNKITTFPLLGEGSIKSLLGVDLSNGQWKATVLPIAEHITADVEWVEVLKESRWRQRFGGVWPVSEGKQ
jgi:hypothetical protein